MSDVNVTGKHIKLRIALTIIFFIIAVAAITIGVVSIGNNEEGFYVLEADDNEKIGGYAKGYTTTLYFTGKSRQIKDKVNEANKIYTDSLQYTYQMYDDKVEHPGYSSLSVINDNINKDVDVTPELYTLLEDLLTKSVASNNYSIYADPLYEYWDLLFSLTKLDQENNDPKNNLDYKNRLETILSYIHNENHVKLNLLGDNKVHLHVSEEYAKFREDNDLSFSYISMNVLKDAYRVSDLAQKLTEYGYVAGYITTSSGMLVSLKDNEKPTYVLYDKENGQTGKYAVASFVSPSSATSLRRYASGSSVDYVPYYVLNDGTIRNAVINVNTGYGDEKYVSSTLFVKSLNVIDTCLYSYKLAAANEDDIKGIMEGLASKEEGYYIYTKNDGQFKAYASENLASYLSMATGYELITF